MKTTDLSVLQKEHPCQRKYRKSEVLLSLWNFSLCGWNFIQHSSYRSADTAIIPAEKDRILQEKEAELKRMQEMLAKMQAQMLQQQP